MVDFRILTESVTDATVMPKRRPTVVASRPGDPAPSGSGEGVTVTVRGERTSRAGSVTRPVSVPEVPSFPENGPGCYPATYETQQASLDGCTPQAVFVDAPCNDESNRCYLIRADVFESQKAYLRRLLSQADAVQSSKNLVTIATWCRNACISVSTALNALNARFMTARHAELTTDYACATLGIEGAVKDRLVTAAGVDSFPTVTALRRTIYQGARRVTGDSNIITSPIMMPTLNDIVAGVTYKVDSQPVGPERKMPRSKWCALTKEDPFRRAIVTWQYGIYGDEGTGTPSLGPDLIRVRKYEMCFRAWNEPKPNLGSNSAVYGPLRQIEYCKTWIRAILDLDPYRYSQQAMQRWTAAMQPWVVAGAISADALTISEEAAQTVADSRQAAASRDFKTAGAAGGTAATVASAIPGGQVVAAVVGIVSALVSLLPGAVGGYACPQLPVLRILREQDCPTSRLIDPSTVTPPTQTRTAARVSGGAIALWGLGGAVVGYLLLEGLRRK